MTREEILAMPAGRELDALVADKVTRYVSLTTAMNPDGTFGHLPPYSTDISAAWEVVEKLFKKGFTLNIARFSDGTYLVEVYSIRKGFLFTAQNYFTTAPEAICKAALIAVMEVNA